MEENLKQVLHKVELLCEQYPEFADALKQKLGADTMLDASSNSQLDEMYEYCIERVVRKQAESYYASFPIESIREQLIHDYCRMERFRRADNFGDFCLAAYQQVECICNKLAANEELMRISAKLWSHSAFVKIGEPDEWGKFRMFNELDIAKRTEGDNSVAELVFRGKDKNQKPYAETKIYTPLADLSAYDIIRVVTYFVGYQAMLKKTDKNAYNDLCDVIGKELYQGRNLNHRGATFTDWQTAITDKLLQNQSAYYFKFLGELVHFIDLVKIGINNLPELAAQIDKMPEI